MLYTAGMNATERAVRVTIRVTPQERDAWKEAAWTRRVSLSEWMRRTLSATAAATKEGK